MARPKQVQSAMQSLKISKFLGKNNVTPPERCKSEEFQVASNVDINDSGQTRMRQGGSKIYSGDIHSLFANGVNGNATYRLFREGTALKKLNSDLTTSVLRDDLIRTNWMKYFALNDLIYYSDEIVTGITNGTTSRSWGLEVPPNQLTLTATTGLLPSGRYLCSLTYVRNDGQESGAPRPIYIDLETNNSGIIVSNIPTSIDSTVIYVNLYLSTRNGEVLYLMATVPNGAHPYPYHGDTKEFKRQLTTIYMGPPQAGQMIQYYNGRIYLIKDNAAWYTLPYNYELMDLAHGFIQFPDRITLFAPVDGGIWVSYKNGKTGFLEGKDPDTGFITHWKTENPAHENSQKEDQVTFKGQVFRCWYWTAQDGIYMGLGLENGILVNRTEDRYTLQASDIAVGFFKKTFDGSKQYGSILY